MGTRHLIAVVKDEQYKVAQCGYSDGYPSGQGAKVLAFLQAADLSLFAQKISTVSFITDEALQALWVECGAEPNQEFMPKYISNRFSKRYPEYSRNTSAGILDIIQHADSPVSLLNDLDFASDSLYCEWGYVIDLDKGMLEVYKGYNTEPLEKKERFYFLQETDNEYTPIHHVASFPLEHLPSKDEFLAKLEEEEEA